MKIAVIGSGISGLTVANGLSEDHEVHVLEKDRRIGGHTATIDVEYGGESHAIDTGFIVFNDRTYPNFIALLERLGVNSQKSSMSFSVSEPSADFEYAGNSLATLFAKKRHLVSPQFWSMLADIVRFNKRAERDLESGNVDNTTTLGQYLKRNRYSQAFSDFYLIPMGAAIWSASCEQMMRFPLHFFVRFFSNHGLLSVFNKPTWRVLEGGSRSYLPKLTAPFSNNIRTDIHIQSVSRQTDAVELTFESGGSEYFDHVVFACHSDQALALLADPSGAEQEVLGAIRYQDNSVILHTDTRLLPKREKVWSSWNYRLHSDKSSLPSLTYNMNILQNLNSDYVFCVSLNSDDLIDDNKIIGRYHYAHPQFDLASAAAQQKKNLISGLNRTSYCGAYWANGFHEDGVVSALDVIAEFDLPETAET